MGNRFCHMELTTGDVEAAKQFYGSIFDWQIAGMPVGDMTYTMIQTGQKDVGGGMMAPMMEGQPTAWLVYAEVKSVDETLAKVAELGGTVIQPRTPVGEMGWIGVFRDPQGGYFGLWESNAPPPAPEKPAAKRKAAPKTGVAPQGVKIFVRVIVSQVPARLQLLSVPSPKKKPKPPKPSVTRIVHTPAASSPSKASRPPASVWKRPPRP